MASIGGEWRRCVKNGFSLYEMTQICEISFTCVINELHVFEMA